METTLLATKLNIPLIRAGLVARPRLVERLKAGFNHGLILVAAPAGFGKTTLLSEWLHQSRPPLMASWFSVEEGENDPVRFWSYFIAALKKIQPAAGEASLPLLHSRQPLSIEAVLTPLVNDLNTAPQDLFLILDDYHFIKSPSIHDGINFLIEHLPLQAHLIFATRIDPPLPLAHFRGRGKMLEITADDLRFTPDEVAVLFHELGTAELSTENVMALQERTEGWVVGLKMTALSLLHQSDIGAFIDSFTGSQRYVADYLLEEVLQQQSEGVRDFLLKTSALERLTGPLCDALTGNDNGRVMIKRLENDNLFTVPLDESWEWYRYEHLFMELLRHQLGLAIGNEGVSILHRKAGQWYEENGFIEDAIHHTLAARDWQKSIKLMASSKASSATFASWARQIPQDVLITNVAIYFRYVWALFTIGQYSDIDARLDDAEKVAPEQTRARVAVVRTMLDMARHDLVHIENHAKQALELLPPGRSPGRAMVSLALGGHYLTIGPLNKAGPLLTEAYEIYEQLGDTSSTIIPLTYLGIIAHGENDKHRARDLFEKAILAAGSSPIAGAAHAYLSRMVYYEWNELDMASSHLEQAVEMSRLMKGMGARPFVYNFLVLTLIARGDIEGARKAMEESDQVLSEIGMADNPFYKAHNAAHRLALAVAEGDPEAVSTWLNKLTKYEIEGPLPTDIPQVTWKLLYARREKADAMAKLQADYQQLTASGLVAALPFNLTYQALLSNTTDEALTLLAEALQRARPQGYVRTFVDEGMALAPLLRRAVAAGIEADYARRLLVIIEAEERRHIGKGEMPISSRAYGLLSRREIEVLKLISEGLTNRQVAERLIVSLSTVKTHIHNIIEKLGAGNRTRAIARARELKLI